ncbi:MAG: hypothetical protein QOE77_3907 [Blastocatellia bacterium]|jgi:hypothetical protein|nr:hypothetical protein [Blastocatellia bacterium]
MTQLPSTRNSKLETRNYFNYFTEIEDTFVRRRGKHLLLSSMDWALIESWKEMGVPLHIALRGIEQAFDSYEAKPRKRSVKTLLYCQEEVEAQYAEWLETRVGASEPTAEVNSDGGTATAAGDANHSSPFSRPAILRHLQRVRTELETIADPIHEQTPGLHEALIRAASLLEELENNFAGPAGESAQKLEVSLTGIERMLSEALRSTVEPEALAAHQREIKTQLRPYKSHMEPAAYALTFENLLLKRLRDQFAIPRLSLFYL